MDRVRSVILTTLVLVVLPSIHAQDISSLLENARTYDLGRDSQAIVALEERIILESKSLPARTSIAQQLAAELKRPDASLGFKQFLCRQLAMVGTVAEVPALAALLADPDLSDIARYALARIDDPAVDAALRGALATAKGKPLIGIIDTLARRRDIDASDELAQLLNSPETAVQAAAIAALARIPSPSAAEALRRRADTLTVALPDTLSDACLTSAETLAGDQARQADSIALCEQLLRTVLRKSARPQFKAAALKGLLAKGGKEELTLLVDTFKRGPLELQRAIAATVVPELANPPQIDAVCALFPQLPPEVQAIVLNAFADFGSGTAAVVATSRHGTKSPDASVRLAAISALASLGESSDIDTLVYFTVKGTAEEQQRADKALVLVSLPAANTRLINLLEEAAEEKSKIKLIQILGDRQAREACPQLLQTAKAGAGPLAKESIRALGQAGGPDELAPLMDIMLSNGNELQEPAVQAVVAVARRAESEEQCSTSLAQKYQEPGITPAAKNSAIQVLGRLAAAPGLPVILAALKDSDADLCKEAILAASIWPEAKPAPDLIRVARESSNASHRVLALRGYLDLIDRDASLPADEKVRQYEAAMALAQEDAEKQRVFSKLGQVPSFSALNLAVKLGGNPARDEAVLAATSIARKVYADNPGLARLVVQKLSQSTADEKLKAQCQAILGEIEKLQSAQTDRFPAFRVVPINADSRFEAAAMVDMNHDGRLDIYCGGFWYQAPNWSRHLVREIAQQDNYFLDFGAVPIDVDGDGWTDIVSGSWHGKDVFWIRNHGKTGAPFVTVKIDQPGNLETVLGLDINGDSRLDLLPNTVDAVHWYEFHRDANIESGARWLRHDLGAQAAGHGIGAGDINGDGRVDIVTPKGWLEQPARADASWIWHAQFDLGSASVPILVYDVNGDHYPDLVWGSAHGYGLQWLEQVPVGEKLQWEKHQIDTTWSQPHFLLLADLDGDGTDEVVTGKRYYAHNGRDPGEDHPLCIYAYKYDRTAHKWTRHVIHEGGPVGFGISTMAADIDKDGDIDLLAPGKSGLYLLENSRIK